MSKAGWDAMAFIVMVIVIGSCCAFQSWQSKKTVSECFLKHEPIKCAEMERRLR